MSNYLPYHAKVLVVITSEFPFPKFVLLVGFLILTSILIILLSIYSISPEPLGRPGCVLTKGSVLQRIKILDKEIDQGHKTTWNYFHRAGFKENLSRYEDYEAIEDYGKAIELDPKFALAYRRRGDIKAKLNQYVEAIKDYDQAVEIEPKYGEAYCERGRGKIQLGQVAEGNADKAIANQLKPGSCQ